MSLLISLLLSLSHSPTVIGFLHALQPNLFKHNSPLKPLDIFQKKKKSSPICTKQKSICKTDYKTKQYSLHLRMFADRMRELAWHDVAGVLARGGTLIGTARCQVRDNDVNGRLHAVVFSDSDISFFYYCYFYLLLLLLI